MNITNALEIAINHLDCLTAGQHPFIAEGRSSLLNHERGNIEAELNRPEPEPVAWVWQSDNYANRFSQRIFELFDEADDMRNRHGGNLYPLYFEASPNAKRIAELEKDNNITHENLAWYMEKYHEHLTVIAELEKSEAFLKDAVDRAIQDTEYYQEQLAALQAKREPLSDDEIRDCAESENLPYFENKEEFDAFARSIETAHGIGVNHE